MVLLQGGNARQAGERVPQLFESNVAHTGGCAVGLSQF